LLAPHLLEDLWKEVSKFFFCFTIDFRYS
jgi:hypothetical protein